MQTCNKLPTSDGLGRLFRGPCRNVWTKHSLTSCFSLLGFLSQSIQWRCPMGHQYIRILCRPCGSSMVRILLNYLFPPQNEVDVAQEGLMQVSRFQILLGPSSRLNRSCSAQSWLYTNLKLHWCQSRLRQCDLFYPLKLPLISIAFTSFWTISYLVPTTTPLFAPRKWSWTSFTDFARQVSLNHGHTKVLFLYTHPTFNTYNTFFWINFTLLSPKK